MTHSSSAAANNCSGSATANLRGISTSHSRPLSGVAPSGGTGHSVTYKHAEPRVALLSYFSPSPLHKKSQAAMEFLMTYGWAILVVLAAIVALAYFGVMSPSRFLPESCTLPSTSGLACLDFTLSPSSASLFLTNGGGRDLVVNNVTVGSCSAYFGQNFADGSSYLFNLTGCSFGSAGEKVKKPLVVSYTDVSSGFSKEAAGSITASLS